MNYSGLKVSKIHEGQPRAEEHVQAEMKLGSILLEVSVKKSLLESNNKHSWSDDDTLPTTVDDEWREQEGEEDFDDLIDGVIFKLGHGDEKRTFYTPSIRQVSPRNVQFVYDDGGFLETNCNLQRLAERKVGELVDEVVEMETPCKATLINFTDSGVESFASNVNEAFDAFNCMQEDKPIFSSSINASTRATNSTPPLVKDFMAKTHGSKAVSSLPFALNPSSQWQPSPESVVYDDESFTATYDDDTFDSSLDDTYTLDDSYRYTSERYEDAKAFKDAARLLKAHASSQGLTGAQVLERIHAEQKKREWASMVKSR